jgi:hypothetical protein
MIKHINGNSNLATTFVLFVESYQRQTIGHACMRFGWVGTSE